MRPRSYNEAWIRDGRKLSALPFQDESTDDDGPETYSIRKPQTPKEPFTNPRKYLLDKDFSFARRVPFAPASTTSAQPRKPRADGEQHRHTFRDQQQSLSSCSIRSSCKSQNSSSSNSSSTIVGCSVGAWRGSAIQPAFSPSPDTLSDSDSDTSDYYHHVARPKRLAGASITCGSGASAAAPNPAASAAAAAAKSAGLQAPRQQQHPWHKQPHPQRQQGGCHGLQRPPDCQPGSCTCVACLDRLGPGCAAGAWRGVDCQPLPDSTPVGLHRSACRAPASQQGSVTNRAANPPGHALATGAAPFAVRAPCTSTNSSMRASNSTAAASLSIGSTDSCSDSCRRAVSPSRPGLGSRVALDEEAACFQQRGRHVLQDGERLGVGAEDADWALRALLALQRGIDGSGTDAAAACSTKGLLARLARLLASSAADGGGGEGDGRTRTVGAAERGSKARPGLREPRTTEPGLGLSADWLARLRAMAQGAAGKPTTLWDTRSGGGVGAAGHGSRRGAGDGVVFSRSSSEGGASGGGRNAAATVGATAAMPPPRDVSVEDLRQAARRRARSAILRAAKSGMVDGDTADGRLARSLSAAWRMREEDLEPERRCGDVGTPGPAAGARAPPGLATAKGRPGVTWGADVQQSDAAYRRGRSTGGSWTGDGSGVSYSPQLSYSTPSSPMSFSSSTATAGRMVASFSISSVTSPPSASSVQASTAAHGAAAVAATPAKGGHPAAGDRVPGTVLSDSSEDEFARYVASVARPRSARTAAGAAHRPGAPAGAATPQAGAAAGADVAGWSGSSSSSTCRSGTGGGGRLLARSPVRGSPAACGSGALKGSSAIGVSAVASSTKARVAATGAIGSSLLSPLPAFRTGTGTATKSPVSAASKRSPSAPNSGSASASNMAWFMTDMLCPTPEGKPRSGYAPDETDRDLSLRAWEGFRSPSQRLPLSAVWGIPSDAGGGGGSTAQCPPRSPPLSPAPRSTGTPTKSRQQLPMQSPQLRGASPPVQAQQRCASPPVQAQQRGAWSPPGRPRPASPRAALSGSGSGAGRPGSSINAFTSVRPLNNSSSSGASARPPRTGDGASGARRRALAF